MQKIPVYMKKMMDTIDTMENTIIIQKQQLLHTEKEFHKFKKYALNFVNNTKKELVKKQRKPFWICITGSHFRRIM
jgi:hypothetical protein